MKKLLSIGIMTSVLVVSGSISYYFLAYVPKRDALIWQGKQREDEARRDRECSAQAASALETYKASQYSLGGPILSSTNYYNSELARCFVRIQRTEHRPNGSYPLVEYIFDAYTNEFVMRCIHDMNIPMCFQVTNGNSAVEEAEASKLFKQYTGADL